MKKLIMFFILFLLPLQNLTAQKYWQFISPYPGPTSIYNSAQADGHLFYYGWPKSFVLSTDGGGSFISHAPFAKINKYDGTIYSRDQIAFADSLTGIITVFDSVYRTTDAGNTWTTLPMGSGYYYHFVEFGSNKVGWLLGSASLKKTSNAGSSWYSLGPSSLFETNSGPFSGIYALNKDTLWVISEFHYKAGGNVFFSTNGGSTWGKCNPMVSDSLNQVHYTDIRINSGGTGFLAGYLIYPGANDTPVIFKTTNYGTDWEAVPANEIIPEGIVSASDREWIIFGKTDFSYRYNVILRTTDSGITWERKMGIPSNYRLSTAEYLTGEKVLIISTPSEFYRSTDFGETFSRVSGDHEIVVRDFALDKRSSSPDQLVVAYSNGDSIIVSRDGGYSWNKIFTPYEPIYLDIAEGNIYLVSNWGGLLKSSDAGSTWDLISNFSCYKAAAYDSLHIAAAGNNSILHYTSDGGLSWTRVPVNNGQIYPLLMASPTEIYAGGINLDTSYYGFLFTGKNGGRDWKVIDTKYAITVIKTAGPPNVFALGLVELWKSSDGGKSWSIIKSGNNTYLQNIAFRDSLYGVLQMDHELYETTDAGTSWLEASYSLPFWEGAKKLEFNYRGDLLALGESEFALFPAENMVYSRQEMMGEEMSYELYQNYPNPFNPVTNIRYKVQSAGVVTLTVYDILGSQVAVLVNKEQSPGEYNVSWNASANASGVYFYQLRAADYVMTKKMVLVR